MRYASVAAFRNALDDFIKNLVRESNLPHNRLKKRIVIERLLARLVVISATNWVFKGGAAIDFRLPDRARSTRDLDLAHADNEAAALAHLQDAARLDLGDFFTFDVERKAINPPNAEEPPVAEFTVRAHLGRLFDAIRVDVGFTDTLPAKPDNITCPHQLVFAGLPPTIVPALPLADQIAQKAHAYTKFYGQQLDRLSGREKDLIDIVLISQCFAFTGSELRLALHQTFSIRNTHSLPPRLPRPPAAWGRQYRQMAIEVGLDPNPLVGHSDAAVFLDPIFANARLVEAIWIPERREWFDETLAISD